MAHYINLSVPSEVLPLTYVRMFALPCDIIQRLYYLCCSCGCCFQSIHWYATFNADM